MAKTHTHSHTGTHRLTHTHTKSQTYAHIYTDKHTEQHITPPADRETKETITGRQTHKHTFIYGSHASFGWGV